MRPSSAQTDNQYEEKVVQVSRVSKKTKGGNKIGFSVLVVVGDKAGKVGVGLGKGPDVLSSIKKAVRRGKKHMITLPLIDGTIPFPIHIKRGAARLMLKPAPQGTGVIAGGSVRAVVEAAGVSNIVSKIMGSGNQASNVYATFAALKRIQEIADLKGVKLTTPETTTAKTPVDTKSELKGRKQSPVVTDRKEKPVSPQKETKTVKAAPKADTKKSKATKTTVKKAAKK